MDTSWTTEHNFIRCLSRIFYSDKICARPKWESYILTLCHLMVKQYKAEVTHTSQKTSSWVLDLKKTLSITHNKYPHWELFAVQIFLLSLTYWWKHIIHVFAGAAWNCFKDHWGSLGPTLRIIGSTGKDNSPHYMKLRVKGQIHPFQRVMLTKIWWHFCLFCQRRTVDS